MTSATPPPERAYSQAPQISPTCITPETMQRAGRGEQGRGVGGVGWWAMRERWREGSIRRAQPTPTPVCITRALHTCRCTHAEHGDMGKVASSAVLTRLGCRAPPAAHRTPGGPLHHLPPHRHRGVPGSTWERVGGYRGKHGEGGSSQTCAGAWSKGEDGRGVWEWCEEQHA